MSDTTTKTTKTIETLVEDGVVDGAYKLYGTNAYVVIFNGYPSDTEYISILEAYCKDKGYGWNYDDTLTSINGIAYNIEDGNIIYIDGEALGRADFENGYCDFSEIEDEFIDNPSRALPSWYDDKELEDLGFEKLSCEFDNGLYEHNKNQDPKMVMENIKSLSTTRKKEVLFKVDFVSQFEMGFCVFVRSDDIEDN